MTTSAFSGRDIEIVTIEKVHEDGRTVTWTNGWSFGGISAEHTGRLVAGATFLLESQRISVITGMATVYVARNGEHVVDEWLWHKTDQDLDTEHAEMVAGFERERQETLVTNRDAWEAREALLPAPLQQRLARFRTNGGAKFETDGWGYELTVCELAVLYAASGQTDDEAINEYARTFGTSGNQHDFAKALSRGLTDDPADQELVATSVSALTPLTGDPDFSGDDQ